MRNWWPSSTGSASSQRTPKGTGAARRHVARSGPWTRSPPVWRILSGLRRRIIRMLTTPGADGGRSASRENTTHGLGWRLERAGKLPHLVFEVPQHLEASQRAAGLGSTAWVAGDREQTLRMGIS